MKKTLLVLVLTLTLILCILSGCSNEGTAKKNKKNNVGLYEKGMKIVSTMEEVVNSEDYISIYLSNYESFSDIFDKMRQTDYKSPVAVYSVKMPKTEKLMSSLGYAAKEKWNKLSPILQKQLEYRMGFSSIVSIINGKTGMNNMAFASACIVSDDVGSNEDITYVYVFENDVYVAVTFDKKGMAVGQYLFLEDASTISDMKKVFGEFGCTVKEIEIE